MAATHTFPVALTKSTRPISSEASCHKQPGGFRYTVNPTVFAFHLSFNPLLVGHTTMEGNRGSRRKREWKILLASSFTSCTSFSSVMGSMVGQSGVGGVIDTTAFSLPAFALLSDAPSPDNQNGTNRPSKKIH